MDKYLMMLYVSWEQEAALKQMFDDRGWTFCKPDLSKFTDKLGPTGPEVQEDQDKPSETSSSSSSKIDVKPAEDDGPSAQASEVETIETVVTDPGEVTMETQVAGSEDENTVTLYINVEESLLDSSGNITNNEALMQIARQVLKAQDENPEGRSIYQTVSTAGSQYTEMVEPIIEKKEEEESACLGEAKSEMVGSVSGSAQMVRIRTRQQAAHVVKTEQGMEEDGLVFKCYQCGKEYRNRHSFKRHKKSHQPGVKKCTTCNQFFDTDEDYQIHNDRYHKGIFLCSECGAGFTRKGSIRKHMLRAHPQSVTAKFKCPVESCPSVFDFEDKLIDHLNVHNGEKPYICKFCEKSFSLLTSLKNHESNHFKDNKTIKCNICDANFQSSGALSNHKAAVHMKKQYICHCGKVFRYKPGLIKHQQNHHHHKQGSEHDYSDSSVSAILYSGIGGQSAGAATVSSKAGE